MTVRTADAAICHPEAAPPERLDALGELLAKSQTNGDRTTGRDEREPPMPDVARAGGEIFDRTFQLISHPPA